MPTAQQASTLNLMERNTGKWIALLVAVALLSFIETIGVCFLMKNPTSENVKSVTVDPTPKKIVDLKSWTESDQVETVDSKDEIPEFPDDWTRVENGNGEYFPKTLNGCGSGVWLMGWRADNPDVLIEAGKGYEGGVLVIEASGRG